MLVWVLVLLLLVTLIYVVCRYYLYKSSLELKKDTEHHYTFKI